MHFLTNLDGKTLFAGACILLMTLILFKGMNTRAGGGGSSSSNKSGSSSNSSNSAPSNDNNNQ